MWGKGQIQEQRQIEKKDKDKEVSHPFQPMRFVFRIKPALDYFLIISQILLDHRLSCLFSIFLSFAELPILGLVCLFKLCVFIFIEVILYMALYVHHQGLRQKASFDWPRYLTLTKQILSPVCSCLQLKKIFLPNLKQVGVGMAIIMNNWQSSSFQPGWEDLEKFCLVIDLAGTFLGFLSVLEYRLEGKSTCQIN